MKIYNFISRLKTLKAEYLFASKLLRAISTVILIPTILRLCGAEVWLQIATIQSIAVMVSPIIQMHWTRFGGATLLQNTPNNQNRVILQSITSRLTSFALINFIALCLLQSISKDGNKVLLCAAFIYASSMSLSNEWFYLAKSNFKNFFANEALPRFIFTSIPLVFIETENQLVLFFLILTLVNMMTWVIIIRKIWWHDSTPLIDQYNFLDKVKFTLLEFLVFTVLFSPVPLVNLVGFDQKFQFTILEKFFRLFMTAIMPITQLARSQILSSKNLVRISRYWYSQSKLLCMSILVLYLPCILLFLMVTETTIHLKFNWILILLFGFLAMVTFAEGIIEEIFILNLLDMRLINKIQLINFFYLVLSFLISAYFKNCTLLVLTLILSELLRSFYMRNRLIRFGTVV